MNAFTPCTAGQRLLERDSEAAARPALGDVVLRSASRSSSKLFQPVSHRTQELCLPPISTGWGGLDASPHMHGGRAIVLAAPKARMRTNENVAAVLFEERPGAKRMTKQTSAR
jgi:hypothetical protein